ncbi:GTPase HflX [Clostridium perfringens]|uniref:GTPase HflX n=1 Tax=Clostridium perfringens TaxID=1502 RepID=UPI00016BC33E|nr:GTPase HflX [Clostridium perfringens]EDT26536.1 GTP binding protein [Clostridium perfringens CPE str. F4969]EGT0680311.1 GTPase HflX [Clostridium perfringens]MCO6001084.1 GTPase HflX [Clostridium perfringens]MCO7393381.1 GTPase HflX [Clostridium perfringens]MCP8915687.1 GTPase HflX [Clostridium perfringens]
MIHGNTDGIRNSVLKELEELYKINVPKYSVCTEDMINIISRLSSQIEREISVGINRKGKVISVAIGDSSSVEIPLIDIHEKRLSGVRIIHTHPSGVSRLSALDISALMKLKLDTIMAIAVEEGKAKDASLGFCYVENEILISEEAPHLTIDKCLQINILDKINHVEEVIETSNVEEDDSERAILVGCDTRESLDELEELAKACDIPTLEKVFQNRSKIDASFYIGRGKVLEIANIRQLTRANLVIFDDELSGAQVKNLEANLGVKVIDRTTLILEIFSRRAKTREAKIQVELAQLKYRAARLMGLGTVMSRTGGGIGTRGPGEKKLEIDRRHIRERIYDLQAELKKIKKIRETQRERRSKDKTSQVSLVGYTNAGKSTLRNTLCAESASTLATQAKDKVFEADMLFATLDTTTRAIKLPDNRDITLTDTVGFVSKLPHELVEAFKSTLEEVIYSDLLCHVVDASSDNAQEEIIAVEKVLGELKALESAKILVLNKIDKADEEKINELEVKYSSIYNKVVKISARERINLDDLLEAISEELPYTLKSKEYIIPYTAQQVVAYLHRNANVSEEEYREEGTYIKAEVDEEVENKCREYEL